MDTATVFARLTKREKQADGTLLVTGVATDPTLDADEQICDPAWLKSAMPAWFSTGANVRYMHQSDAVGVATKYDQAEGDQHIITARIVDDAAIKKVEHGVLQGFSIGIRNPRIRADKSAPGGVLCGGSVVEVSLVDRPANPACMLTLAKSATPGLVVKAADFDSDTRLVRVEELVEKVVDGDVVKTLTVEDVAAPAPAEVVEAAPVVAPDAPAVDAPVAVAAGTDSGAPADAVPDAAGEGSVADGDAGAPEDTVTPAVVVEPVVDAPGRPEPVVSVADEAARRAALAPADGAVGDVPGPDAGEAAPVQESPAGAVPGPVPAGVPAAEVKSVTVPLVVDADMVAEAVEKALVAHGLVPPAKGAATASEAVAFLAKHATERGRATLIPDVVKADGVPTHDVDTLRAVRNGLLDLLIAEATEAKAGEDETYDMRLLLDCLGAFLCWWGCEAAHGEAPPSAEVKAAGPGTVKAAGPGCGCCADCTHEADQADQAAKAGAVDVVKGADCGVPIETPAPEAGSTTSTTASAEIHADPDTVKAMIAEATKGVLQEVRDLRTENDTLVARLAQVEKAAAPGGPVRTRPTAAGHASREGDAIRAKVAELRALAKTVAPVDVAREYDRRADALLEQLRADSETR